jgi:Tol biopolymer transport system component
LYTINVDGSGLNRLTITPENEFNAIWRPDGEKIGYLSSASGSLKKSPLIKKLPVNGGKICNSIKQTVSKLSLPAVNPDRQDRILLFLRHQYSSYSSN